MLDVKPARADVEPAAKRSFLRAFIWFAVGAGFLLLKLKAFLFLLVGKSKLLMVNPLEGFSIAQFAIAGGSMVVTIIVYAYKIGFPFAVGFVLLTLVHELGHAFVIRLKGLRASAMVFIPFVGGAVALKDQPRSAYDDAQIGLAGPVVGTIASAICYMVYLSSGDFLYLVLAHAGYVLNLLNLLPIGPLDGGRIAGSISKWMWVFGGLALLGVMITQKSPLLLLVLVLSVFQVYKAIKDEQSTDFYQVTGYQRAAIAVPYFALLLFLGLQTVITHLRILALQN